MVLFFFDPFFFFNFIKLKIMYPPLKELQKLFFFPFIVVLPLFLVVVVIVFFFLEFPHLWIFGSSTGFGNERLLTHYSWWYVVLLVFYTLEKLFTSFVILVLYFSWVLWHHTANPTCGFWWVSRGGPSMVLSSGWLVLPCWHRPCFWNFFVF